MQRRSHKKSRRGCASCKQRHIKCDESQPSCSNCLTADIQCVYAPKQPLSGYSSRSLTLLSKPSNDSSHASSPSTSTIDLLAINPSVNILHLELFNHVVDDAGGIIFGDRYAPSVSPYLRTALSSQFLMTEVLAISALHLALNTPERYSLLRDESVKLQDEALLLFNKSVRTITEDNVKPAFLYSGLLGLHYFSNMFSTPSENVEDFFDQFIQSIRLLRGVLAILSDWIEYLLTTDLKDMLIEGKARMENAYIPDKTNEIAIQFRQIQARIASSTLDQDRIEICQVALQNLVKIWWSEIGAESRHNVPNIRIVTSWPVMLSAEFTELLVQRRPEALVILGYYAVLLHQCNTFWGVRDGARLLLRHIEDYLGPEWDSWLVWPRSIIYS